MKAVISAAILSFWLCPFLFAEDTPDPIDNAHLPEFIRALPTHEEALQDVDIAIHTHGPETGDSIKQQKEARARLEKTMAAYDQLYNLLHVGTSVFDYPGLLGLTREYSVNADGQTSIMLGVFLKRGANETHPVSMYLVLFDKTGIIIKILKRNTFPTI